MTRLTSGDVQPLEGSLAAYDVHLKVATGLDLAGLALDAAGLPVDQDHRLRLANLDMAVVPMTTGLGIIGGFSGSVASILSHIGCRSFVSQSTDVAGFAEAVARRPAAIFMADDRDFVAMDPERGNIVHNTPATAQGFASGLARMAGGVAGKEVLVMGCGPVGLHAAEALIALGAKLSLSDINPERCLALAAQLRSTHRHSRIETQPASEKPKTELIFDATNTGDHIGTHMIAEKTFIAAPGMPCGITVAARRMLGHRLLHDPLQIGVATMAAKILAVRLDNRFK